MVRRPGISYSRSSKCDEVMKSTNGEPLCPTVFLLHQPINKTPSCWERWRKSRPFGSFQMPVTIFCCRYSACKQTTMLALLRSRCTTGSGSE